MATKTKRRTGVAAKRKTVAKRTVSGARAGARRTVKTVKKTATKTTTATDLTGFRKWLKAKKRIQYTGNVASRLNRARRLTTIRTTESVETTIRRLERTTGFQRLSGDIQSNLRRAVRLFREYTA